MFHKRKGDPLRKTIIMIVFLCAMALEGQTVEEVINKFKLEPLTTENVAKAILELKIENPVEAFKQSVKESGWKKGKTEYKSKLATIGNNVFGMRKARRRMTTALKDDYCGHVTYSHWIYSVVDYKYWQDFKPKKKGESHRQYLQRRQYDGNKGYADSMKYIKLTSSLNNILTGNGIEKYEGPMHNYQWDSLTYNSIDLKIGNGIYPYKYSQI